MSQPTVTSSTTTTTTTTTAATVTTVLSAGRRRKRAQLGTTDSRSPSPEHYIDLTVDSPISTRQRKQSSTNKFDNTSNNNENLNNTIVIEDFDSPVISRPPRPVRQKRTNRIAGNSASSVGGSGSGADAGVGAAVAATTTATVTATASSTGITSTPDVIELKDHNDVKKNGTEKNKIQPNNEPATVISCPICFEELLNTSLKPMSTKCGHIFCENCIQSSLSSRKKCPVCMAPVTLKSCIRLHL